MKLLLDTNVVSQFVSDDPEEAVVAWLDKQDPDLIFTSTVTIDELWFGARLMAQGRRRRILERALDALFTTMFARRVWHLDEAAARVSGEIEANRQQAGRRIELADSMIAGIAIANGSTLVTRNVKQFRDTGATLVNPWVK